jgi:signal transduction histidine kinase
MITAASIVSWYFLAAQIAAQEVTDVWSGAVFFLDSASNISVTMLAATLWLRSPGGLARTAALRLWAALGILAATDLLFALEMLKSTYISGSPIDLVYAIAVIGIVAAADAQVRNPAGDPPSDRAQTGRSDLVVFISATLALIPLVVESARSDPLKHPMAATALGVTLLMLLGLWRQRVSRRAIGRLVANRLQLEHQLWQAQKQDAIGRLAGGIAHDFNNILAGISAHAQLVRVGAASDPAHEARAIEFATQRAAVLVRRLLTFSRDASPEQRPVVLGDVVRSMQPMLRQLVVAEVSLTFDVADERAVVRLAEGQLEQVLLNLAINARDAIPRGGQIGIATRRKTVEPGDEWQARGVPPGVWAMLDVRDNGTGMDAATQARLFEPFFTTKEASGGTGLGLATVHGMVDAAGGRIVVDSAAGRGTTMTIFLPLASDVAAPAAEPGVAPLSAPRPATILVVDDEILLRGAITRYLARLGYRVLEASDAEQAEFALQRADWHVDLMLTDVRMQGVSGPELTRRIRQRLPSLPVLYMSGHADLPEGTPPGDVLHPPFDLETIAHYVDARLSTPARQ